MKSNKKIGVVLQGGGALGAYQYGAIKALYEEGNFSPSIVTGVSIGAINAAVWLGGRYGAVKSLEILWDKLTIPTFPMLPQAWQAKASKIAHPNMYYMNSKYMYSPLVADSVYDITPFYNLLKNLIDIDKLNSNATRLVIESVNVETANLQRFSNHAPEGISLEKIVSSMSIPPNFPMVKVDNNYYWDGGLFANMPLSPAINYLESLEPDNKAVEREVIVMTLFRKNAPLPTGLMEINDRIKEIIFASKLSLDKKSFEEIDSYIDLIHQIDEELPRDSKARQHPAYQRLMRHKKINRRIILEYNEEGVEGTDDFTPDSINHRIRTGYRDAVRALQAI